MTDRRWPVPLLVVAVLFAACGGDDDATTDDAATDEPASVEDATAVPESGPVIDPGDGSGSSAVLVEFTAGG